MITTTTTTTTTTNITIATTEETPISSMNTFPNSPYQRTVEERDSRQEQAPAHYQSSAETEHNNCNDKHNDDKDNDNDNQFNDKQQNDNNATMMQQLSPVQNE
jgi:hypothetical protein